MNSLGTSNARIKISPAVISRTEMPVTVLDLAVKVFPFLEQYSRLKQPVIVKFETGFLWKIEAYCQGTPLSVPEVVWVNPRLHMAKLQKRQKVFRSFAIIPSMRMRGRCLAITEMQQSIFVFRSWLKSRKKNICSIICKIIVCKKPALNKPVFFSPRYF